MNTILAAASTSDLEALAGFSLFIILAGVALAIVWILFPILVLLELGRLVRFTREGTAEIKEVRTALEKLGDQMDVAQISLGTIDHNAASMKNHLLAIGKLTEHTHKLIEWQGRNPSDAEATFERQETSVE